MPGTALLILVVARQMPAMKVLAWVPAVPMRSAPLPLAVL